MHARGKLASLISCSKQISPTVTKDRFTSNTQVSKVKHVRENNFLLNVNLHIQPSQNVSEEQVILKLEAVFFFLFSLLLVKIIHFLIARRQSNSQRRQLVEPAAGPF